MSPKSKDSGCSFRRQQEKLTRRQEILQAARHLFAQKGYHSTTLDDIAQLAQFGKGTIYNYFANKEVLFGSVLDQLFDEVIGLTRTALDLPGTAREKFAAFARLMFLHYQDNSDLLRIAMREINRLEAEAYDQQIKRLRERMTIVWELLAQAVARDIRARRVRQLDAVRLAALFLSMVHASCVHLFDQSPAGDERGVDQAVNFIISILFDGIAKPHRGR